MMHGHVPGEPGVRGLRGRDRARGPLVPGHRVRDRPGRDQRRGRGPRDQSRLPHSDSPLVQAAPGSGVCSPWTNFSKNASRAGSSAPVTVRWCPQADSMIGSFCPSTGLISVYGVFFTFAASASTSALSAEALYVTHTAPCSSECTALVLLISSV